MPDSTCTYEANNTLSMPASLRYGDCIMQILFTENKDLGNPSTFTNSIYILVGSWPTCMTAARRIISFSVHPISLRCLSCLHNGCIYNG